MNDRHAATGREMIELASARARQLIEEGYPLSPSDVAKWVTVGSHLERLATGAATSRQEVTVTALNAVITQVLAVYRETVSPLVPAIARDDADRGFATGINGVIEALKLPAADDL